MIKESTTFGKGVSQHYFFMDIDDSSFDTIEICLGPKVEPAHEIIISALVNTYCPTAKIEKSKLSGQIR